MPLFCFQKEQVPSLTFTLICKTVEEGWTRCIQIDNVRHSAGLDILIVSAVKHISTDLPMLVFEGKLLCLQIRKGSINEAEHHASKFDESYLHNSVDNSMQ